MRRSRPLCGEDDNGKTWEILVGPIEKRRANLASDKNLADYIDHKSSRFDATNLFKEHCNTFPILWILVQSETAMQHVEVGCEYFSSLTGYISAPCRTRLCVRTYGRISMLANILPKVYIDKE